jgi:Flp pilus assembly CpaF family ATPase
MTGHKGVMTTIHAGSCAEALERFDELVQNSSKTKLSCSKKLWDLILYLRMNNDGERGIEEFHEN